MLNGDAWYQRSDVVPMQMRVPTVLLALEAKSRVMKFDQLFTLQLAPMNPPAARQRCVRQPTDATVF